MFRVEYSITIVEREYYVITLWEYIRKLSVSFVQTPLCMYKVIPQRQQATIYILKVGIYLEVH